MTDRFTWTMDPELTAILREVAASCDRPVEELARILLLNGASYTLAMGLSQGYSQLEDLHERVKRLSDATAPDARHVTTYPNLAPLNN